MSKKAFLRYNNPNSKLEVFHIFVSPFRLDSPSPYKDEKYPDVVTEKCKIYFDFTGHFKDIMKVISSIYASTLGKLCGNYFVETKDALEYFKHWVPYSLQEYEMLYAFNIDPQKLVPITDTLSLWIESESKPRIEMRLSKESNLEIKGINYINPCEILMLSPVSLAIGFSEKKMKQYAEPFEEGCIIPVFKKIIEKYHDRIVRKDDLKETEYLNRYLNIV